LSVLGAGLAFALGGGDVAEAQEAPRYELHVGYAFLRDQDIEINFPVGWSSSFAFNLTDSVGVVADVGGNYKSEEGGSLDVHAFLGGARYSFRGDRVTPYVEGLFGVARAHASGGGLSESASDLAAQAGVGVGFKVSDRICVRAGFDFRNVFTEGESAQEFRVQAGLSFGFGGSREEVAVYAPPAYTPPRPQAPPTVSAPTAPPAPAAPPPQAPPTLPPAAAPAAGPFGRARELLSAGSYSEAAAAFRADLPAHAASMFTIPVGVYCDVSNLAQQVQSADAQDLLLVRLALRGQLCYGLYWGLFSSGSEAQAALAQLPPALRSPGQAPISVSRVLSRAR
jgi:opacity protein-like surface antigen